MPGVKELGSLTTMVIVSDVVGKVTSGRPGVRNNCIGSVGLTSPRSSVTGGEPGGFARIVLWSLTDLAALAVLAIRRGASGAQESPDAVPGRRDRPPRRSQGGRAVPFFATVRRMLGGADRRGAGGMVRCAGADSRKSLSRLGDDSFTAVRSVSSPELRTPTGTARRISPHDAMYCLAHDVFSGLALRARINRW